MIRCPVCSAPMPADEDVCSEPCAEETQRADEQAVRDAAENAGIGWA